MNRYYFYAYAVGEINKKNKAGITKVHRRKYWIYVGTHEKIEAMAKADEEINVGVLHGVVKGGYEAVMLETKEWRQKNTTEQVVKLEE